MKISIFGLGYVGSVSAACLANLGHHVIGVDFKQNRVDMLNAGKALMIEPELSELTAKTVASGHLRATQDANEAILHSALSFICVGTPSQKNNSIDLQFIINVCKEIGHALKEKTEHHTIACRSTIFPGSMRKIVIPTLEKYSGKKAGKEFSICFNPEFMKEATAVYDFSHPAKNVIGILDKDHRAREILTELNDCCTDKPTLCLDIESAELVKYCDNIWHALKVGFANEIGKVCKALAIDSHIVMDVFCQDTILNLSSYYLKPGFAFGGSCLPKDLRAFLYETQQLNIELPIIHSILPSNQLHIENALNLIMAQGHKQIGILGMSFKANTDDIRESPTIVLIERLLGKGYELILYDKNVSAAKSQGANQDYLMHSIPHISSLMVDTIEEVLQRAKMIVIGNKAHEFEQIFETSPLSHQIIDLVRIKKNPPRAMLYNGICW